MDQLATKQVHMRVETGRDHTARTKPPPVWTVWCTLTAIGPVRAAGVCASAEDHPVQGCGEIFLHLLESSRHPRGQTEAPRQVPRSGEVINRGAKVKCRAAAKASGNSEHPRAVAVIAGRQPDRPSSLGSSVTARINLDGQVIEASGRRRTARAR